MKTYLRSLSPWSIPDYIEADDLLKIWQERILHSLFMVGAFFGLAFGLFFAFAPLNQNNLVILSSSFGLFIVCLFFFAMRQISYWVRSITSLAILFIFSNIVYFSSGWTGMALILLLVFSFLSTALLYQSPSRIGLFLSLITLLVWATLRLTNIISGVGLASSLNSLGMDILIVLLAGLIFNLAIGSLKSRFLEINRANKTIQQEKNILADQMQEQTTALERRVTQLRTAAEITKSISSVIDPQILLRQVADSLQERFGLYYVGVFLVDPMKEFAVLQYGTGEAGRKMMANRHRLAVGGYSMIGWTTQTRKPRIAMDIGAEAVHFDNPLLPETRSELALPITTTSTLYGALTIQSVLPNAFDENDILVLQSIADNLAISLENNSSFESTQKARESSLSLRRNSNRLPWSALPPLRKTAVRLPPPALLPYSAG